MSSFTTQRKLAQVIQSIADGERKVEVVRQVLAEHRDFEPYTAFKRIDQARKGYITSSDLKLFLQENDVFLASRELFHIFRRYDSNQKGRLTFSDFCKNVLPQEDTVLRKLVTQRESRYIEPNELLTFEVEWAMARIFDQEAKNYRANEALRDILISAIDFNIRDAFNAIDEERFGYIDQTSVDKFMRTCDKVLSEEEINAFFRAVSLEEDGKISYTEFVEAILPFEPYNRRTLALSDSKANLDRGNRFLSEKRRPYYTDMKQKLNDVDYYEYIARSNSAERRKKMIESSVPRIKSKDNNYPHYSSSPLKRSYPVKTYADRFTAEKEYEPRDRGLFRTPSKVSRRLEDYYESNYVSTAKKPAPRSASKGRSFEEELLVKSLKDQITFDRELEEAKKRLALRSDFNLLDAFKIFDKRGKGYISLNELERALSEFGLFPTKDELYLFFRRYDKDSDGLLRYSDFCKAITPQSSEYSKLLSSRTPLYLNTAEEGIENFTMETRRVLKELITSLIEVEGSAENIRQKLARRPMFSIHDAFQLIDRNENGFITLDEFRAILDDYGIFASTNDLINLVKRYDKNMDGRVSYTEFINEMTPKQPSKY